MGRRERDPYLLGSENDYALALAVWPVVRDPRSPGQTELAVTVVANRSYWFNNAVYFASNATAAADFSSEGSLRFGGPL